MKKKIIGIFVCTLLIAVPVLSVAGNVNDETNPYLDLIYNNSNGVVVEAERYEEKCETESGVAGGCWVYKYTIRNNGNTDVTFWAVHIRFPTQYDWCNESIAGAPANWHGSADGSRGFDFRPWHPAGPITLGPGGSVNHFIIKTECWPQDEGGASAIPTEGEQIWELHPREGDVIEGTTFAEQVDPVVHDDGKGYTSDHPAGYSFDKDHTTYAKTTGGAEINWIIYDFKVVRQTHIFRLFSRYDSDVLMSPAEIQIAVGENDDGTIDQVVGNFILPQAAGGEIVSIDLDEIIEKRYVQMSILSRYNNQGDIVDPTDAEFAEVEFSTYVIPTDHWPEQPVKPSGSTSGKPGIEYTYTTSSTDPDDDLIYYTWDWGDGELTDYGPYESGEIVEASHIWDKKGNYQIKVVAIDELGAKSEWSDPLSVSMPRNKIVNRPFLNFLQQYPILYQLLQRFLRL